MNDAAVRLPPGYDLVAFDSVVSTNDEAKRLMDQGAPAGTLVWAREQRGGRGRDGRSWSSPRGNLYASLLLRPAGPPLAVAQLGFVTALAIGAALGELIAGTAAISLKWPNDVLVRGRKAAGILLESEGVREDGVAGLVIGFGINVAHFPADARLPATSLHREGVGEATPETVLARVMAHFDPWARRWRAEGFAPVREAWCAQAHGIGRPILVRLPRQTLEGVFADIDAHGALLLDTADGRRSVTAGDVFFPSTL